MANTSTIPDLTDAEFAKISQYMQSHVGIQMPSSKRVMIQSRLMSRVRHLNLSSFGEYIDYVFNNDPSGTELVTMIDSLTTNKTEFFRENDHFIYLRDHVLPEKVSEGKRTLQIWSAGCSSGEEPYTLSIVLKEYQRVHPGDISDYSILATDISTKVLDKAANAVYDEDETNSMTSEMRKTYFLRSKDPEKRVVRVKPELRGKVTFQRLNFMDASYPVPDSFNVIFCRNVLIYFDKPTQETIIRKFTQHLEPNGYLFLGHSETIFGMDLPLKSVAPTVYRKTGSN